MEAWYLVLALYSRSNGIATAIIPDKYPTEQDCRNAGKYTTFYKCIPAPKVQLTDKEMHKPTAGYYCGQYPERCSIKPQCVMNINSGKLECN